MWSAALAWRIEFEDAALKELAKLDKPVARRILAFLRERVAVALKGSKLGEFWKYRVGGLPGHCPHRGRGAALAGVEGGQPAGGISVKPPYQRHTLSIT